MVVMLTIRDTEKDKGVSGAPLRPNRATPDQNLAWCILSKDTHFQSFIKRSM